MLIRGVFEGAVLKLLQHFVAFEDDRDSDRVIKIWPYHQFHAVGRWRRWRRRSPGTSGAGWCGPRRTRAEVCHDVLCEIVVHPAMENPTLVCLTDRNDLDDQLFARFARCSERAAEPVQASAAGALEGGLRPDRVATIQKFLPGEGRAGAVLSDRRNIWCSPTRPRSGTI